MDVLHPQLRSHDHADASWPVLVWDSGRGVRAIASAPLGGGLGVRRWVVNAQVPSAYARRDPARHLRELTQVYGWAGPGVGMLTAAAVRGVRFATEMGVEVAATVGLGTPTWAAAPCDVDETPVPVGTINVVAYIPQRLSDAALVNAVATATEAKAQALWESDVEATGTATDALCITCPTEGPAAPFAGPRSTWGARLARALHAAVGDGIRGWPAA
ncbi:MAG TPA: adenosylcobinamide amidohydrolase [Acidimicrobiales bacterium]|nr:adenosylcobinamide amidohydrolase [Acidimicrobiales bacterium]